MEFRSNGAISMRVLPEIGIRGKTHFAMVVQPRPAGSESADTLKPEFEGGKRCSETRITNMMPSMRTLLRKKGAMARNFKPCWRPRVKRVRRSCINRDLQGRR